MISVSEEELNKHKAQCEVLSVGSGREWALAFQPPALMYAEEYVLRDGRML